MRGIGAAAVMLASVGIGFLSVRQEKMHLQLLGELQDVLLILAADLAENQFPLPELIHSCCRTASGEARVFFLDLQKAFSDLGEKSFYELWEQAVELHYASLTEGERRELLALGRQLGRSTLQRQLAALERCTHFFAAARKNEEEKLLRERRMRLALPTALGGMLLILLL